VVPRPDHVVILVLENHSITNVLDNPDAPYINSLATAGANMVQSYAETHPSQPNYLALFSGSTNGLTDDSCPNTYATDNLGAQALAAGIGYTGYAESLPSVGYTGCTSGRYARKHSPWVNFSNVPAASNQPLTSFPTDYPTLPTVSFVIPNLDHDMHDGTIAQGDTWIHDNLDGYVQWAKTHNSLLVLRNRHCRGPDPHLLHRRHLPGRSHRHRQRRRHRNRHPPRHRDLADRGRGVRDGRVRPDLGQWLRHGRHGWELDCRRYGVELHGRRRGAGSGSAPRARARTPTSPRRPRSTPI